MSSEAGAPSPAPTAPAAQSGDGKPAAANVSAADAVRLFASRDAKRTQSTPPTADTPATTPNPENNSTPAAPSAPAEAPEATSQPPEGAPEAAEAAPETEGTEAGEAEAEEVLSTDSQTLDAKTKGYVDNLKDRFQKRIDKVTARAKASEGQVEQLKQQMAQLQASLQQQAQQQPQVQPLATEAKAPLPDIKDPQALAEYRKHAKETVRWADRMLVMGIPEEGIQLDQNTRYTKEQILGIKENAQVALEDTIPEQERYFTQKAQTEQLRTQARASAYRDFPFLNDPNAPEQQLVKLAHQSMPWLLNSQDGDRQTAIFVLGAKAWLDMQKGANGQKNAKEGQSPAPAPTKPAPRQRPPGDQAAVSTVGTVARNNPDAAMRTANANNMEALKAKRGASSQDAAAVLAARDAMRQGR